MLHSTMLLAISALFVLCSVEATYKVGVSISDITGPAAGIVFCGYAHIQQVGSGIHLRQFARTFIVEDENGNSAVFVSTETGMMDYFVHKKVVEKLKLDYGELYNENNVIISATHTHSTPGGYNVYIIPGISTYGFSKEYFNGLVEGIYQGIKKAHESKRSAKIFLSKTTVDNININRSPTSYLRNPESERQKYKGDTDNDLVQMKFVDAATSEPFAVFNWYPIHPTTMNMSNTLISSDNVGYAAYLIEQAMNQGALPGKGQFVGAFASTNLGDVSPNTGGSFCPDGTPCEDIATSTCQNKAVKCLNRGPGKDMFDSVKIIGTKLADKALELLKDQGEEITGPVKAIGQNLHVPGTEVRYTLPGGKLVEGKGCSSALGISFAAGTLDGEGLPQLYQGITENITLLLDMFAKVIDFQPGELSCHNPKPVILPTAKLNVPSQWHPQTVTTHLLLVGNVAIAGVPGEFTTMSGRRFKESTAEAIKKAGGYVKEVIAAGLSDVYTHYIATYEEYQAQRYEAASTIYGPHTLAIYQQHYANLAEALVKDLLLDQGPEIEDISDQALSLIPPIIMDSSGSLPFGTCKTQPVLRANRGDIVSAQFVSGHPRNNLLHSDSFLTIERLVVIGSRIRQQVWSVIATDANWETKFTWTKDFVATSTATIEWEIGTNVEAGTYRICHKGAYKPLLGSPKSYQGCSNSFQVM